MEGNHMRLIPAALIVGVIAFIPSRGAAQPLQSFEDLGRRVRVGNQLLVEDSSGVTAMGRLTALTAEELTLETNAGERRFPSDAVATVAVRRSYAGRGALIGAGVGAVAGYLGDPEYRDFDLPALLGAGAGAIAGALIHRMKTVYRRPEKGASLAPAFSRGRVGAVVALRW
jgi:hypothetical protein